MSSLRRKSFGQALFAVALCSFAWLVPVRSRAEALPPRVALAWKAPSDAGCASEDEIRHEVARLTDRSLVEDEPRYQIEALALVHEGSWVASVALRDERGRILGGREVSGSYLACRELDVPVALVVATLLDGLREEQEPAPPPALAAAPAASPARRGKIGIAAHLAGALGLVPKLALGLGLALELPLGWPVLIEASAYLPGEKADAEGRGVRSVTFHAGAAVCPRLFGRRHELRLCGSAQAGAAVVRGVGLTESRRSAKPLFMLGIEPKVLFGLTPSWALSLSFAAYWVAVHPRFHWEIEGEPERSLRTQPFALVLRIGVIDFLR